MSTTLYTYFRSSASYRVRIALQLKGLAHNHVPVHLLRGGGEQRSDAYAALNPSQLVQVLEHGTQTTKFVASLSSVNGDINGTMQGGVADHLRHTDTQRCCTRVEAVCFIGRNPEFQERRTRHGQKRLIDSSPRCARRVATTTVDRLIDSTTPDILFICISNRLSATTADSQYGCVASMDARACGEFGCWAETD
jgi:hypothetical protein